mmetsp:Transcript_43256/g.50769  ORF Transcript_43256/g.50769 Transcript_43256/m.50769 type:complete len:232 (+) Transcript_43256:3195-3890(+)
MKPNGGCTFDPKSSNVLVKLLLLVLILVIILIGSIARKFNLCSTYSVFMPILQMQYLYMLPLFISRPPVSFLEPLSYLKTSKFDFVLSEYSPISDSLAQGGTKLTFINFKAIGYDSGMMIANMANLLLILLFIVFTRGLIAFLQRFPLCFRNSRFFQRRLECVKQLISFKLFFYIFLCSYLYVTLCSVSELLVHDIGAGPLGAPSMIISLVVLVLYTLITVGLFVFVKRRK